MDELTISSALPSAAEPRREAGESGDTGSPTRGFGEMIGELLTRASADQSQAEQQARALVAGEGDIVDTMIAMGRAELSLRFVVTLRNRALEAYQEIMRLQV